MPGNGRGRARRAADRGPILQLALAGAETWVPAAIEFVESLPLTAIGKVNTRALRARYAAEHGAVGTPA
jgi:non-ribosomal peptide synthetase component E (peptide arylation enzyme)